MTPKQPQPFPIIYHDATDLYLEWPTYALRFPFTEGGLRKALNQIPRLPSAPHKAKPGNIADRVLSVSGKIARVSKGTSSQRAKAKVTDSQRSTAMDVIRKLDRGQN